MSDEQQHPQGAVRDRARMPEGYGVPKSDAGLLPWSWAQERLEQALLYWVMTVRPDGRPHATPIWGAWVEDRFYFEGGPDTRRGRNLAANPAVGVHIERGDDVVIIEGMAEEITRPDPALAARLVAAFGAKYEPKYNYRPDPALWDGGGLYVVRPRVVLAWGEFPRTVTRWRFAGG
jgi:hypothetical protein